MAVYTDRFAGIGISQLEIARDMNLMFTGEREHKRQVEPNLRTTLRYSN